jgi:two-component system phosphate regulon sensor histidine kinase PhoR
VPLKSVVEETLSSFENDIKDKKISVECSVEEDIVVSVDVDVFKYLIDNLISNAVKFNRQDGKIVISGYRKDGSVILSVFDTGCGIPQSEIDCVHKRFYRASNVKKDFQGTGLGLSIVNRVVQAHNGKLEIESELNDFTEFRVLLPEIIINSEKY